MRRSEAAVNTGRTSITGLPYLGGRVRLIVISPRRRKVARRVSESRVASAAGQTSRRSSGLNSVIDVAGLTADLFVAIRCRVRECSGHILIKRVILSGLGNSRYRGCEDRRHVRSRNRGTLTEDRRRVAGFTRWYLWMYPVQLE